MYLRTPMLHVHSKTIRRRKAESANVTAVARTRCGFDFNEGGAMLCLVDASQTLYVERNLIHLMHLGLRGSGIRFQSTLQQLRGLKKLHVGINTSSTQDLFVGDPGRRFAKPCAGARIER